MTQIHNLIAQAPNGKQIRVSLVPFHKQQSTLDGFKSVAVGRKVRLASGKEVHLNLDGKSFYTGLHQLFKILHMPI